MKKRRVIDLVMAFSGLISFSLFLLLVRVILTRLGVDIIREKIGVLPIEVRDALLLFLFFTSVFLGTQSLLYFFPEIRPSKRKSLGRHPTPLDIVKYVISEDEALVLDAVMELGKQAYQFEIARKTKLSRVKVHRIIKRLAERGIVLVDKEWKKRKIRLAPWLLEE